MNFNTMKNNLNDWVYDTNGNHERILPIIDRVLPLLKEIVDVWKDNKSYQEYENNCRLFKITNFDGYKNFDKFFREYSSTDIEYSVSELMKKGYDTKSAELGLINFFAKKSGIILPNNMLEPFYLNVVEYKRLLKTKRSVIESLISEAHLLIYNNTLQISAYRKRYSEFFRLIGKYEDIDEILGQGGIKLINKEPSAIEYVLSLETLYDELESEKSIIEIHSTSRK